MSQASTTEAAELWEFDHGPDLPLQYAGEIHYPGWPDADRWAVDAKDVVWATWGHDASRPGTEILTRVRGVDLMAMPQNDAEREEVAVALGVVLPRSPERKVQALRVQVVAYLRALQEIAGCDECEGCKSKAVRAMSKAASLLDVAELSDSEAYIASLERVAVDALALLEDVRDRAEAGVSADWSGICESLQRSLRGAEFIDDAPLPSALR